MSVSAAAEEPDEPKGHSNGGRRRPKQHALSQLEWHSIRLRYESSDISHRDLAKELGISYSTLSKRSMREKWSQSAALVHQARSDLAAKTVIALESATSLAADMAAKQLVDELQPWIAEQKAKQIKRAIARSTKAQERLDGIAEGYTVLDKDGEPVELTPGPKEESFLAAAEEKYDSIIRRNLGMNEGSGLGGSLSIQVLTNQAYVQVSQK